MTNSMTQNQTRKQGGRGSVADDPQDYTEWRHRFHRMLRHLVIDQLGWNNRTLAHAMKVSESTTSNWLAGKKAPEIDTIYRLARELDVPAECLLNGVNPARAKLIREISDEEFQAARLALLINRHGLPPGKLE